MYVRHTYVYVHVNVYNITAKPCILYTQLATHIYVPIIIPFST